MPHPVRAAAFMIILLVTAIVLFALPYPSRIQAKRLFIGVTSTAPVSIVGPSTIDNVWLCDKDRRTIPEMMTQSLNVPVVDLSAGGQSLSDSINLAAISGVRGKANDVVLPIAYPYSDDWTTPPLHSLLLYKILMPKFDVFAASNFKDFWQGIMGEERRIEGGYSFDGERYADYRGLSAVQFAQEKALESCPGSLSHNLSFTRSYFWWTHVATQENPSLYDLVGNLSATLKGAGKRLLVVIGPVNVELLAQFEQSWADLVKQRLKKIADELTKRNVNVLDLSRDLPADQFSLQWCACAHLTDQGRQRFSSAVVAALRTAQSRGTAGIEDFKPARMMLDGF